MEQRAITRFNPRIREVGRVFRFRLTSATALGILALACAGSVPERAAPHERVVSLAPSITELLFSVGAGPAVVGRTRWASDPPEALAVPSVGDGLNPNVEAVAARQPDLVILYDSPANAGPAAQLRQLGIETVAFRMDRLDDVAKGARLFGALIGVSDVAEEEAARFSTALDSARRVPRPADRPRVLILSWDQPPIVIGAGSFQSELLDLAGAENVFADLAGPSGQVTIEIIAERNPDLVLLTGGVSDPSWGSRPEWQVVPAVRQRRFVIVDGSEFSYPSFRALTAVQRLRQALAEVRE